MFNTVIRQQASRVSAALKRSYAAAASTKGEYIFRSLYPDVPIPNMSITDFVTEHAEKYGDKPCIINGLTGKELKYSELKPAIGSAADQLKSKGFQKGDCFALISPNVPEYAIGFHAVATLGGVNTTINPIFTEEEIRGQLQDSEAKYAFTVPALLEKTQKAAANTNVKEIFVLGSDNCLFRERHKKNYEQVEVDYKQTPFVLPYSSGTSGKPKGVMLSHTNVVANINQIVCDPKLSIPVSVGTKLIAVLPWFHIYGMVCVMNAPLRVGAATVTVPNFEPENFLKTMQDYKIEFAPLVPPLILFLAKHPLVSQYDLSSLRNIFSGAAPLDAELQKAAEARLNCVANQGYGMTEMSPVSHILGRDDSLAGSVGQIVPNMECKIVDEHGNTLGPGLDHSGELLCRGPNVMLGYLKQPEATAECLSSDGWLRTGDVASVDENGNFYIVDRVKELIKSRGYQVAPAQLEGYLLEHKEIADCAVIGIPHERFGEVPKAFVVKSPGSEIDEETVKSYLAERVAEYKQLHAVQFVNEIPKSAAGKILRRLLRDM